MISNYLVGNYEIVYTTDNLTTCRIA